MMCRLGRSSGGVQEQPQSSGAGFDAGVGQVQPSRAGCDLWLISADKVMPGAEISGSCAGSCRGLP